MQRKGRIALAALVAPAAPTVIILLLVSGGHLLWLSERMSFSLITVFSYMWSYTVGIIAYLLMRRLHWVGLLSYLAVTILGGVISFPLYGLLIYVTALVRGRANYGLQESLHHIFNGSTFIGGFVVGLFATTIAISFWIIVRPDRREVG
jgi:hypothetical protein